MRKWPPETIAEALAAVKDAQEKHEEAAQAENSARIVLNRAQGDLLHMLQSIGYAIKAVAQHEPAETV